MSDFETILACLLIPIAYVLIYIAGKYDVLALIPEMLRNAAKVLDKKNPSEPSVLYLCDREQCSDCNNIDCRHTSNIEHAANFEKLGVAYWEKEK